MALRRRSARSVVVCVRSTSSIWAPTRRMGFSAVRALWKIIAASRPRTSRSVSSLAASTSSPPKVTDPAVMRAAASRMRRMA
jgi:hypothetical protein